MALPPGPSLPPLVQTWHWLRRPYEFFDECAARYGEIFQIKLTGFGTAAVVSSPEAIKEIFAAGPEVLLAGQSNALLRPFVGDHSILVLDGAEHLRQRKLLMPAFHGERMQAYGQAMLDEANASIDTWPLQQSFVIQRQMQAITLRIILRTIFGVAQGPQFERMCAITRTAVEIASNPLLLFPMMQRDLGSWSPWGKFMRLKAAIDDILRDEVAQRRRAAAPAGADALSLLLEARDEQGAPMTFPELRDELVTMLVAGHETTATALSWTLCWLLRDPALHARLCEEVATAAESGRLVPERVAKLELLDATVREGLRIRPVAPLVGRITRSPMHLSGYEIPSGWVVAPAIYLAHRRQSVFPAPDRFEPQRFLGTRISPTEWLPFGGGTRRCIGAAFATYEMKMVLSAMLWRTSLKLEPGYEPRPVRRGVTIAPAQGVPIILHERRRSSLSPQAAPKDGRTN